MLGDTIMLSSASTSSNFNTVLYTGTSAINAITSVGFQPDLVWLKQRNSAQNHGLFDTLRGVNNFIMSNSTSPKNTRTTDTLSSFDDNGFTLTAYSSDTFINYSGRTMVAWCFKAGGAAVSNTDGSIASQVSANPAAGFSIVKYTGGGVYTNTVGHGLSSPAEIIIQKATGLTVDWYVHTALIDGSNDFLELNTSDPKADNIHNFAVTSTTFTDWAWGSNEIINYCFHSVPGYSKMGKYTGATAGVTENIGFKPSMVIIKNATQSDPWGIFDNKRPSGTGNRSYLYPSTADDEDVYGGSLSGLTLTSTGFAIDNTNSHMVNQNGETYLYMAFAT